jgi:methionyl-tRNA formyltransferase
MKSKNIVVMGKGDLAVACIPIIKQKGCEITVFATKGDERLIELCRKEGLECQCLDNINTKEWIDFLNRLKPDIILSLQCPYHIKPEVFGTAKKAINLHFSLLPRHRGMYPIAHAILAGDKFHGATLHYIISRIDAGDIIAQCKFEIPVGCTAEELYHMTVEKATKLFEENFDAIISDREIRTPQKEEDACYHDRNSLDFSKCEMKLSEEQKRFLLAYYFPRFQRPFVRIGRKKFEFHEVEP